MCDKLANGSPVAVVHNRKLHVHFMRYTFLYTISFRVSTRFCSQYLKLLAIYFPSQRCCSISIDELLEWAADAQRRTETKEESSFDATRKGNWRKSGTKKGVAYQFKTFDEVIAEGGVLKKRLEVAGNAIKV